MKKIVFIFMIGLMCLSLNSFNTNDKLKCYCNSEMYVFNCDEVAVQTYPIYDEQAGGQTDIALLFAQASYDSCLRNGGSGLGWSYALHLIRHTYPELF